jgi:hypothetical protein
LRLVRGAEREVKVEIEVVHTRVYKHEVEKWQWKGGGGGWRWEVAVQSAMDLYVVYSTKKETSGAYWKMETDGEKNKLWASEGHECLILKQLTDLPPCSVSVVERILTLNRSEAAASLAE